MSSVELPILDEIGSHWRQSIRPLIVEILADLSQKERWLFRRVFADQFDPEAIADELELESSDHVAMFKSGLLNRARKHVPRWKKLDDAQIEALFKLARDVGLGQPWRVRILNYLELLPGLDRPPISTPTARGETDKHLSSERKREIELTGLFDEDTLKRRLPWAGSTIEIIQKQTHDGRALFYVSTATREGDSAPASFLSSPIRLVFREEGKDQPQAVLLTEGRPAAVVPETLPSDWSEVTLDLYIEPPELVEEPAPKAVLWIGSEFFALQPQDISAERSWRVKGLDYEKLSRYRESQPPVRVEHPDLKIPSVRLDEFDKIPPSDQETGALPKEQSPGRDRPEPRPVFTGHVSGWRLVFSSSDPSSVSLQVEEGEAEHSSLGEMDPGLKDPIRKKVEDLDSRDSFHPTLKPAHVLSGEGEETLSPDEKKIDLRKELGSKTVEQRLPRLNTLQVGRLGLGQEETRYYVRSEGEEAEDKRSLDSKLELKLRSQEGNEEGTVEFSPGNSFKLFSSSSLPADWEKLTLILKLPPMSDDPASSGQVA